MTQTAAIYARVSSAKQKDNYSLETQVDLCAAYAASKGYAVVEVLQDAQSGAVLSRPEFDKLRSLPVDHIICLTLDRLSRSDELDTLNVIRDFEESGKTCHAVDTGEMHSGDWKGLELYLRAKIAHDEREKIRERTVRGRLAAIKDGKIMYRGVAKYGYDYNPEARNLTVNEAESRTVFDIFNWCAGEKLGFEAIAKRLTSLGVPTRLDLSATKRRKRQPATCWNQSTVAKILHSEIYIGRWYFRQYETQKIDGKVRRILLPKEQWGVVEVPAIVPLSLWEAAQQQIALNNARSPRNTKQQYLLRGHLTCVDCGYAFDSVYDERLKVPTRYRCGGQYKKAAGHDALCRGYIPSKSLDNEVWELVAETLKNPDKMLASTKVMRAKRASEMKPDRTYLKRLTADLEAVDASIRKLLPLYLENVFTKAEIDQEKIALSKRRTQIANKIAEVQERLDAANNAAIAEEKLIAFCREIGDQLDNLSFAQKRAIIERYDIRGLIQRVDGGFNVSLSGKIWLGKSPDLQFRLGAKRKRLKHL